MLRREYNLPGNAPPLQYLLRASNLDRWGALAVGTSVKFPGTKLDSPTLPKLDQVVSLEKVEEDQIKNALIKCGGNQTETAKSLGISRSTLWRKIKAYHLENFK